MISSPRRYWMLVGFLLTGSAGWMSVQAVAPRLNNILPAGGQRGTEIEVRFTGQRLEDTKEIVFYHPGISVASMEPGTNRVKATLKIAADCTPGEHLMRLRTATGVSELRTFWVSGLTNLAEAEPNNDASKAQRIPLNATVSGIILSEDVDSFLVQAAKGTRLAAEVEGIRLGRGAFDAHVSILDSQGKILSAVEDSPLVYQDAIASIVAPADGDYVIQVRETSFAGREDYTYRLQIGTFPRPMAVYPLAAKAGESPKVKFIGDVKGDFEQTVKMPNLPNEKFAVFAHAGAEGTAPSPNWMRVTAFPTALEAEPNDTREQAGPAPEAPVVFNGVLGRAGDDDWFRFRARKGQSLQISVYARRLRSPLDAAIQVVNAKGSALAENDDSAGPDSSLTFKPEEDGEYSLLVRDHLKRGGPTFVYCVEVTPVEPSLTIKIPEVARNDTQSRQYIAVPRGNRFATLMSVRRANAPGDLLFNAENLPKGVKLVAEPMPAKLDQFPILFEASDDAPVDGRLIQFSVAATNGVSGRFRNDIELVQGPNNTSFYGTRVDELLVATTEAAPFKLRIVQPKVPLVQGGTMDLQIVAERDPGFEEAVNVRMLWSPPGITSLPDMTIPQGSNSVTYVLNAKADAEIRQWPVTVLGSAKVRDGDLFVSSPFARLEVGEAFVVGTMEKTYCEPGQSTNIVVKLEQRTPFEGKATVRLIGLSEKVSVPVKEITRDDKEVIFPVKVDPGCPLGSQRNLFCAVSIVKNGEVIPHNIAAGGSFRVIPPKKALASR